jgi:dihydropteroate synthase
MCGVSVVRVHDVKETKEALSVVGTLAKEGGSTWTGTI